MSIDLSRVPLNAHHYHHHQGSNIRPFTHTVAHEIMILFILIIIFDGCLDGLNGHVHLVFRIVRNIILIATVI